MKEGEREGKKGEGEGQRERERGGGRGKKRIANPKVRSRCINVCNKLCFLPDMCKARCADIL